MFNKRLFSLIISLLILPQIALADSLPERIDRFSELFDFNSAVKSYDIRDMQSTFPTRLLSPESMQPQTASYPLKDIQQLYQLSKTCNGKLPLSPLITEPLVFTRAMCKGSKLTSRWFSRSALIHPGGGTYAARYVEKYPEEKETLKKYMHIQEREEDQGDELLTSLKSMNEETINALISGANMFLEKDNLWLRRGDYYYIFDKDTWSENVEKAGLSLTLAPDTGSCFVQRGNICWNLEDHSQVLRISMIVLVIANIMLVAGWAVYRWNSKRQEMKSRMLVLQILTHELRTPIASLSLTVEGFRREFEHLPETVYDEFRRLCEDTRRLRQLAEASKDYLQSDNQPLATEWIPSVEEWLMFKLEDQFPEGVQLCIDRDVAAKINVYWLGTCVDNLIRNAVKYGVEPVVLNVSTSDNKLVIEVKDNGVLTSKDWTHLRKPFVSKSGLGLGLTIVESMVGRMGGKMKLIGPPTTFILEIPCETDVATR
ncbi:histidine kinase [Vibrio navarrensis]|uniref:sensor histidine kinase VxrA n=1 Tax=Vibrio navarrensis TaxID=29495 RepID=UPI00186991A0|nr:sensor histidine kinase VxrA [Vibrio navarrensis]MBE4573265.1 histidine kinase [Vibrio navarrensis]